jgi:hypothetical protein
MRTLSRKHIRLIMWLVVICAVVVPLVIVGCAPRQAAEGGVESDVSDDEAGEAIVVAWSMDSDCTTCHTAESSAQDPTAPALYHEEEEGVECVTCHTASESELTQVHEGTTATDKMPARLKKTKVSDEACLSCHETGELATLTQASTALTDDNGLVVNPHDRPENSSHVNIVCTDCHQQHQPKAEIAKNSMATCTTCHHERVFGCGASVCHD